MNSRTPKSVADINTFIENCEQFFSTLMKYHGFIDGTIAFNPVKHGVLRDAVIARAALLIIIDSSLSWQTLDQAQMAVDVLYQVVLGYMNILTDQDFVEYLKGL